LKLAIPKTDHPQELINKPHCGSSVSKDRKLDHHLKSELLKTLGIQDVESLEQSANDLESEHEKELLGVNYFLSDLCK